MTLKEAKKLIENSKEKLQLVVKRDGSSGIVSSPGPSSGFQLSSPGPLQQLQTQQQFKGMAATVKHECL